MNKNKLIFCIFSIAFNLKVYCQLDTIKTNDFSICVPLNSKFRTTNSKTIKLSLINKINDNIRNIIVQKVDPNPTKIDIIWDLSDEQIKEQLFFEVKGQTFFQNLERRNINGYKIVTVHYIRKMFVNSSSIEIIAQANYLVNKNSLFLIEMSCLKAHIADNKILFENILNSFKLM